MRCSDDLQANIFVSTLVIEIVDSFDAGLPVSAVQSATRFWCSFEWKDFLRESSG